MSREQRLARVFVELADTLVDDFDDTAFVLMRTHARRNHQQLSIVAGGIIDGTIAASQVTSGDS